ncbi:LysR family transcriptional regulator [Providencia vermicola]|uniref:LysR family transcriptional regulator n=1 Tax=Providencia TaxID=586 RepID=UPI002349E236
MDNMSAFPILIAVADALSLTKAAKSLNMTKSGISKALKEVEDTLGVKLFHRTTRTVSLTEAGEAYIGYIRQSYQLAMMAKDVASQFSDKIAGTLRISAPMSFGTLHLAKMLPTFMQLYPELNVELFFDDKVTDLITDGYDIAVRIGELPDSSLVARKLFPCTSGLYASKGYLARFGTPTKVADLREHNCLSYSFYQAGQEWVFYQKGKKFSHVPKGSLRVNNSQALIQAVKADIGIALLPHFITVIEGDDTLIPLLTNYQLPDHNIYVVYPEKEYLPRKIKVFIDFLYTQFAVGSEYPQRIKSKADKR